VCAQLPPDLQDAARFAYCTCWRLGAVRALEWRYVNLDAGTLRLRASIAFHQSRKTVAHIDCRVHGVHFGLEPNPQEPLPGDRIHPAV
jgi:hypothetical protein